MKKIEISKEDIIDLYINKNLTRKEVGNILGVSVDVIQKRITDFGIKKEKDSIYSSIKFNERISKEDLYYYYILQNHSIVECSDHFNMSLSGIKGYIRRYNMHKSEDLHQEKIKQTMLERYGVERALQVSEFSEKYKETMSGKSKEELDEIFEKRKQTCLEKYGTENPVQNESVKEKTRKTCQERYGSDHPLKGEVAKQRKRDAVMQKYGVTNVLYLPEVQAKKQKTIREKYGVENYGELEIPKEIRDILNSKQKLTEFINKCKHKTVVCIAQKLGCSDGAVNDRINKFDLRHLIDQSASKYEIELSDFLDSLNVRHYKSKKIIPPLEIDFYCPDYKIGIEFNGDYYHSSIYKDKEYHFNKSKDCKRNGVRLIHVWENEWIKDYKKELIKLMLTNIFNKNKSRINAKDCKIKEISDDQAKEFNEKNHLCGHMKAELSYGLFYKNKLVQLLSAKKVKDKYNPKSKDCWMIVRDYPDDNSVVIGGFDKLLKHFIFKKNPSKIIGISDFNKLDGSHYESSGFIFVGYGDLDCKWISDKRIVIEKPSKELKSRTIAKIWGCGSKKYLWINPNKIN